MSTNGKALGTQCGAKSRRGQPRRGLGTISWQYWQSCKTQPSSSHMFVHTGHQQGTQGQVTHSHQAPMPRWHLWIATAVQAALLRLVAGVIAGTVARDGFADSGMLALLPLLARLVVRALGLLAPAFNETYQFQVYRSNENAKAFPRHSWLERGAVAVQKEVGFVDSIYVVMHTVYTALQAAFQVIALSCCTSCMAHIDTQRQTYCPLAAVRHLNQLQMRFTRRIGLPLLWKGLIGECWSAYLLTSQLCETTEATWAKIMLPEWNCSSNQTRTNSRERCGQWGLKLTLIYTPAAISRYHTGLLRS